MHTLRHSWLVLVALLLAVGCKAQQPKPEVPQPLRVGAEVMLSKEYAIFPPLEVALVANQTSLVGGTHLVDTLLNEGVHVTKIFCPEHGFRGTEAAGAKVDNSVDPKTGLPIISLYGKNKKPTPAQLKDVDVVIFDLQDVGCRFYTYLSTTSHCLCLTDLTPMDITSMGLCSTRPSTALLWACTPCRLSMV